MMAVDPDNKWDVETIEMETETSTAEVEVAKVEEAAAEPAVADSKEEKKEEVKVQRNKRGYMILEFERNFELRENQIKEETVETENQDP